LPVASIGSREVLSDTASGAAAGLGVCVGKPVPGATVRVIRITDAPIAKWSSDLELPPGEIGEITVRGPMVTAAYYNRPEQTALAKIADGDQVVHRMGDVGYLDTAGRLWMCGRKSHRVVTTEATLFSVPVEEILNQHEAVRRTALVGVGPKGTQKPVVLVEREPSARAADEELVRELRALCDKHEITKGVRSLRVFPGTFPVDVRHNAKIEREKLARWAEEQGA
jgi:acyl-CoA synthetase (AMP-forming)/AMP-acid ligase II